MTLSRRFHSGLYPRYALRNAMKAYSDFASITVAKEGDYFLIVFTSIDPDYEAVLVDEFSNYALGEVIERRSPALG